VLLRLCWLLEDQGLSRLGQVIQLTPQQIEARLTKGKIGRREKERMQMRIARLNKLLKIKIGFPLGSLAPCWKPMPMDYSLGYATIPCNLYTVDSSGLVKEKMVVHVMRKSRLPAFDRSQTRLVYSDHRAPLLSKTLVDLVNERKWGRNSSTVVHILAGYGVRTVADIMHFNINELSIICDPFRAGRKSARRLSSLVRKLTRAGVRFGYDEVLGHPIPMPLRSKVTTMPLRASRVDLS
jgi:hypothetical protein